MRRLASTMQCDVRLQIRNGFYYAAAAVAVFWALLLNAIRLGRVAFVPPEGLDWIMPLFILSNLAIGTFYFMAGLVLLEKGEGTLAAQVVTPLRQGEYLASKTLTLTGLALAETLLIVAVGYGVDVRMTALLLGTGGAAALLSLAGFVAVSRYDSINEYLFPSCLYVLAALPPFLDYLDVWNSWLVYLHPLQAPLLLTKAAFQPIESWQWLYAILWCSLWVGFFFEWSRRAFNRFVVRAEGSR